MVELVPSRIFTFMAKVYLIIIFLLKFESKTRILLDIFSLLFIIADFTFKVH